MTSFLAVALRNAARGFRVHPLRGKDAFLKDWPNVATTDEPQIRASAVKFPDCNVGVAAGHPDPHATFVVAIVDSDRVSRLRELAGDHAAEWFNTYSVTSGRPDRAHFYYRMTDAMREFGNKKWAEPEIDGNIFEVKVHGGQVVAEGSTHPITGDVYRITQDLPLIPFPAGLLALMRECRDNDDGPRERVPREKIGEGRRHDALVQEAGRVLRVTEMSKPVLTAHLQDFNEQWIDPPLDAEEVERVALSCNWQPEPPQPQAFIGTKPEEKKVTDWRELFHSKEDALNAPPVRFLIKNFLQREGVTAIAAPVRERKSLIALNVCHALLTGEKLFDHFEVIHTPERVLYLVPECSLGPFTDRVKKIGLMDYVGQTFFYRTLSAEGHLKLNDEALRQALHGSVVVLDTAIRFLEGDENSSADVRAFADSIFALLRGGAESVVMLHHSPKGSGNGDVMTLENAMRGSGDMGAFLACCWGTRLQDPSKPYESASFLSNLKQRDFQSQDFEVTSGEDCRLHIVGDPSTRTVTLQPRKGNKGNKDGKDEAAEAVIRANPKLPLRKMQEQLAALGIDRGTTWIGKARARINGTGVTCGEAA